MIDETFYKWNLAPYPSGKIYPGGGGLALKFNMI